jgi:para-aminobenzoate synthetase component 1
MISHLIRSALKKGQQLIYLHSSMPEHPESRCSYLAIGSEFQITAKGNMVRISDRLGERELEQNPWDALKAFRKEMKDEWLFGYLGYDLKNSLEDLSSLNPDPVDLPDLLFIVPEVLLHIDGNQQIQWLKGESAPIVHPGADYLPVDLKLSHQEPEEDYIRAVERAREHIHEGNFYEINLSHQQVYDFEGDAFSLYEQMVANGPVPFGAFMNFEEYKVSCLSPERFLKKTGQMVESQPIKGTRERGSAASAEIEIAELRQSEKERAENLMIVDLVRNDLSRVAIPGSVEVDRLFEIQSFETVHQMVSTVRAKIAADTDEIEIIKACFPMGSMTGAPKIASMKVIDELETYKRGLYSGAIGYFSPDQEFDFNVVIRTAIQKGNKLFYSTGGAITSDSDAFAEWKETQAKARALTDLTRSAVQ